VTVAHGCADVPPGKLAAVVTSLEMGARPMLRPEPPDVAWWLRHERRPGLDWYRDLFRRIGQDWLWVSRLLLSDAELARVLHDPRVEVRALEFEGRDEGLLELDFRNAGECELSFFGLTAGLIGRGAGRWLMNRALEAAWSRPIGRLWVHTCTLDHPGALAFYVRSGFTAFRRQIEVLDDPRRSGVIPRTSAPQIPLL
jgi:GNAT superfamily N-acetyltransferase